MARYARSLQYYQHPEADDCSRGESRIIFCAKEPGASTCTIPFCTSYLRGKGGIILIDSKSFILNPDHSDVIKEGDLMPGDTVSTDQYEYRVKGRLPNTRGK